MSLSWLSEINRSLMFGWSASYTSSLISNHNNRNSRAMLMYIFEFIVIWKCRQKVRFKWFKCFLIHLYLTRQCLTFGFIHCIHSKVWKVKEHLLLVSVNNMKPLIHIVIVCLDQILGNGEISVPLTFMKSTRFQKSQRIWQHKNGEHIEPFILKRDDSSLFEHFTWIIVSGKIMTFEFTATPSAAQLWKC